MTSDLTIYITNAEYFHEILFKKLCLGILMKFFRVLRLFPRPKFVICLLDNVQWISSGVYFCYLTSTFVLDNDDSSVNYNLSLNIRILILNQSNIVSYFELYTCDTCILI